MSAPNRPRRRLRLTPDGHDTKHHVQSRARRKHNAVPAVPDAHSDQGLRRYRTDLVLAAQRRFRAHTDAVGWLEDQDAKNQRRMEADKDRLGGDDWVERIDDDLSDLDRVLFGIRGLVSAVLALGVVAAAFVFLIRWIVSGG